MLISYRGREVQHIVLDFDGTFYNQDNELEERIWHEARRRLIEVLLQKTWCLQIVPEEAILDFLPTYIERSREVGWQTAYVEMGGTTQDFIDVTSQVTKAEFLAYDERLAQLLRQLLAEVPVFIFTGSNRETVLEALEILVGDLSAQFEERLLALDDMELGYKPEAAAYKEMRNKFEVDPNHTVYVDDQPFEVQTAHELGFMTFFIAGAEMGGEELQQLQEQMSCTVIKTLHELWDYLQFSE